MRALTRILPPIVLLAVPALAAAVTSSPVVDTGQDACFDDSGTEIACPAAGQPFSGQDAQHAGHGPRYVDHGDGTVTDLVTGLMWQRDIGDKVTWAEAVAAAPSAATGGHVDWRLPTIDELYSLIDFRGVTGLDAASSTPYLDTAVFEFEYGDTSIGERHIDAQYWTSTEYVSTTMDGDHTVFGVNFADGRIKGYGTSRPDGSEMLQFVRYVRGASGYGDADLVDNLDGTVTDHSTGLMWAQADSGFGMDWEAALAWVGQRNAESHLGHDDWRLPNAKELQSLVDYSRSPATHASAAIDPVFQVTQLPDGEHPYFWSSTTHLDGAPDVQGTYAVYVAFGRALGWMESPPGSGNLQLLDVHGAGAQRSDPKSGDPDDFPFGHGPQGDVIRIESFVRLVRDAPGSLVFRDGYESGDASAW